MVEELPGEPRELEEAADWDLAGLLPFGFMSVPRRLFALPIWIPKLGHLASFVTPAFPRLTAE